MPRIPLDAKPSVRKVLRDDATKVKVKKGTSVASDKFIIDKYMSTARSTTVRLRLPKLRNLWPCCANAGRRLCFHRYILLRRLVLLLPCRCCAACCRVFRGEAALERPIIRAHRLICLARAGEEDGGCWLLRGWRRLRRHGRGGARGRAADALERALDGRTRGGCAADHLVVQRPAGDEAALLLCSRLRPVARSEAGRLDGTAERACALLRRRARLRLVAREALLVEKLPARRLEYGLGFGRGAPRALADGGGAPAAFFLIGERQMEQHAHESVFAEVGVPKLLAWPGVWPGLVTVSPRR